MTKQNLLYKISIIFFLEYIFITYIFITLMIANIKENNNLSLNTSIFLLNTKGLIGLMGGEREGSRGLSG